jgi:hypothetical protein
MKNGKSPGEDNINLELCTYAPEQFKMRLPQFLNNTSTKKTALQMKGEMPLQSQHKKGK